MYRRIKEKMIRVGNARIASFYSHHHFSAFGSIATITVSGAELVSFFVRCNGNKTPLSKVYKYRVDMHDIGF